MSLLQVAGTVIGAVVGGPAGAVIGSQIGAGINSLVNPEQIEGPRLDDLEVQMASYGSPIPHEWGVNRHVGTVIWPKNLELKESSHTESAKGGPETTTYTYSCSIAVLLCEGPIKGVRRIWANKKLVYDASADNTGPNKDPAINGLRIYRGTEDQQVDPLIEATDGPSPAYLGYAYCVFEDFVLTEYANRPPQFEFEIVTEGEESTVPPRQFGTWVPSSFRNGWAIAPDQNQLWVVNGNLFSSAANTGGAQDGPVINVYDLTTLDLITKISIGTGADGRNTFGELTYNPERQSVFAGNPDNAAHAPWFEFSTNTLALIGTGNWNDVPSYPGASGVIAYAMGGLMLAATAGTQGHTITSFNPDSHTIQTGDFALSGKTMSITLPDFRVVFAGDGLQVMTDLSAGVELYIPGEDAFSSRATLASRIAYDAKRQRVLWTMQQGKAYLLDVKQDSATYGQLILLHQVTSGQVTAAAYDPLADVYYVSVAGELREIDPDTLSVNRTIPTPLAADDLIPMPTGLALIDNTQGWFVQLRDALAPEKIPLSKIVSDICTMKDGLAESDINVAALTPLVDGYSLGRQMTRRAAIEALMPIYFFDAVENGGVLQFVMRGGATAATIGEEDRAARDFGGDLPDSLSIVRAQDLELPFEVELEYPDVDADHLVGAQYSRRITKDTKQKTNLQTAVVMGATKAKAVTEANLYEAWLRGSFKWTTSRKYSHLLPTDVVELPTKEAIYRGRITSKREQPNGIIEWEAKQEAVDVYTQSGAGAAPTNYVSQSVFAPGVTTLELMDIPLLRDQDAGKGFPVAMAGTSASWPGAQLFKSGDGGSTYDALYSQSDAAVIGRATNALGDFTGGDIFDDGNSLTVKINPGGQLVSYSEAQLLSGLSAFALGVNGRWEIIQYRTATLTAPLTYTLTGLLRGRKGTEWATSTHQAGDHFVMLNTGGIQFYDPGAADANVQRLYKAPAFRAALSTAAAVPFTDTQVRLRPYSVANLRIDPASDGYLVSWAGRSILGGGWRDGGDVARDAAFVAYDVTILKTDGTAVKTYSVTQESFAYTSAMASLDLGLSSATFSVRVAQRNSDYGQGIGVTVSSDGAAFDYDVPAPQQAPSTPGTPGSGSSLIAVKSMQMRVQSGSPYSAGLTSAPPYYIRSSLIYQAPGHGLKVGDYVWRQKMPELMYKTGLNPIGPFGDADIAPPASGVPAYKDFLIFNRVREVTADTFTLYDLDTFQTEAETSSYLRYTWEWVTFAAGTVQKVLVDGSTLVVDDPFTQPLPSEYVRPLSPYWAKLWDGSQFIAEAWGPDDTPGNDTQRLMVSSSGTSGWATRPASGSGHGRMAYGNGRHVSWNGWFGVSTDNLQTWTRKPLFDFPLHSINGGVQFANVQFINGQFVAVGEFGMIVVSTDGLNWTETDNGTSPQYRDKMRLMSAAFDGTYYVVTGYLPNQTPVLLRGTSLGDLVSVAMPHIGPTFVSGFWGGAADVLYAAGRFVVVGLKLSVADGTPESENQIRYQPYIATSTDGGATWTDVTCPSTYPKPTASTLDRVVRCNGVWLATGNNVSATSTDGVNWTEIKHLGTNRYGTVTNGSLVMTTMNIAGAVENNMIWTSTDCINWTKVPV